MLLLIDCQNDFIEGGTLPVTGAQVAMEHIADYISTKIESYDFKVLTIDWHPFNHSSFKDNGGEWPIHCLQHSSGAAIHPLVLNAVNKTPGTTVFLTKGLDEKTEEYSIFANAKSKAILEDIVTRYNISQIDICGLAGDICVLNTLKDGIEIFGADKFKVLQCFSPSIDGGHALDEFIKKNNLKYLA